MPSHVKCVTTLRVKWYRLKSNIWKQDFYNNAF